jgi:hypothetical protein
MNRWIHLCLYGVPLVLLLVPGCGPAGRSPLGKVAGTVYYNGEPVEEAEIVFHNPKGRSATGQVADGSIQNIITYDRLNDGVPLGTLTVTIHPVVDREEILKTKPGQRPKNAPKPPFPKKYADPKTSGLIAEIKSGKNVLRFELTD